MRQHCFNLINVKQEYTPTRKVFYISIIILEQAFLPIQDQEHAPNGRQQSEQ